MRKIFTLCAALLSAAAWSQAVFTNATSQLGGTTTNSGGCMGVCDMNGDGLDDLAILHGSDHVYVKYQQADGSFVEEDYGIIGTGSSQWGWAIGDVDNNGHKDIVSGGNGDGTHYLRITSPGVYAEQDLNGPGIYTQCMSLGDLDNNGRVDVFACHDDGPPNIWFTDAGGVPQNNNAYIDWSTSCTGTAGDMSGNYGSTFTDFDNDGDLDLHISHCRQGVNDPNDCRRWDRLFVNDGTNQYADQAALYGLENHEQVWTSDFGDFDNDGDLDVVSTTHSSTMMLFENDGTGHYTNITAGSGLEVSGFFLQGLFRDFDNDGWLDVLTASAHHYFQGHGDGTFTEVNNVFPAGKEMHSFGIGDLNNDGFEDVFASYGDGYVDTDPSFPDRLWLNTPNGNHWFRVRLQGTISNRDAIGARVTITGPFGQMIREVHAGESYGIVNSFAVNFGLGQHTQVTGVEIRWPSGLVETAGPYSADQTIMAIEGLCTSPSAQITPSGPPVICSGTGGTVTLEANAGYTYLWNTSETSESITVSSGGIYTVVVEDGSGCSGTASIEVVEDPDETPTVTLDNAPIFCQNDQVTLTSSPAASYLWSTGETSQSITVTTTGTYSVTIQGTCSDQSSAPLDITVLDAPDVAPTASDVFLPAPGPADLTATGGSNIMWFDVPSGGEPIGAGSPWITPFLSATTTFWCADVMQYGGDEYFGGQTDRLNTASPGQYHSNADNYLLFDAFEDLVIRSVKVYANGAGGRDIGVVDQSTGTTIASGTFSIPDGESRVDLNFEVPAGGPYGLRVMGGNPQLWRDGNGSNPTFPYALGTLGSITNTTVSGPNSTEYYYFFYDWEVETPIWLCAGPTEDVVVDVAVGVNEVNGGGVSLHPNPADDLLEITADVPLIGALVYDVAGRAVPAPIQEVNGRIARLDVSTLDPGEYMVRILLVDRITQRRFVVR